MRLLHFLCLFFVNHTATTEIYSLSLHDALPILRRGRLRLSAHGHPRRRAELDGRGSREPDRKSTRLNSSHANISYAVFCLKKKKKKKNKNVLKKKKKKKTEHE